MAKQGTYEERVRWALREGGREREARTGVVNRTEESTRARVCECVRAYMYAGASAFSPKWNSMTELEREKGNSDGEGEGNEMV